MEGDGADISEKRSNARHGGVHVVASDEGAARHAGDVGKLFGRHVDQAKPLADRIGTSHKINS